MAAGTSLHEPGYWPWPDLLANALVVDGQLDEADAFLRPHEQRAGRAATARRQARLGYARGRLHGALGDIRAARRSFETSLELLERTAVAVRHRAGELRLRPDTAAGR